MIKKIFSIAILIVLLIGFSNSQSFSEVSAGVAIFLFGMMFLSNGFKEFTGGVLEKILKKFTNKTWKSLIFGFCSSTLMQSSSLVSILTISFLSAELITLVQGVGIIFGSNIGTTTGAWLIAAFGMKIDIASYAMPMLVFGAMFSIQKSKSLKGIGSILSGIGFLFFGIHYMKEGFSSLQQNINLIEYTMTGYQGVLVFTLIGIIATVIMQSSHATIILVIAALSTGQISYDNALALVIGANIGTTVTAVIGSMTANINGKRLAIADVIFKSITGILFIIFIFQISDVVNILASILGITENDYLLKVAIFHSLFNIVGVICIVPFLKKYVALVEKIIPEKENTGIEDYNKNKYLNGASYEFPDTSIVALVKESKRLFESSVSVILELLGLTRDDLNTHNINEIKKRVKIYEGDIDVVYGEKVKMLFGEIFDYISKAKANSPEKYYEDFNKIKFANINIVDAIKGIKHIQRNLLRYTKSSNSDIKKEYEDIVRDLIFVVMKIDILANTESNKEKIKLLGEIEKDIIDHDIITNGEVDTLIRKNKISNAMTTSLIKDTGYKNDITQKLLKAAETIFNKNILLNSKVNHLEGKFFGLSDKKVQKIMKKFKNRKSYLKQKLKNTEDKTVKLEIENEIDNIEFLMNKYNN